MQNDRTSAGRQAMQWADSRDMPVSVVRHADAERIGEVFDGRRVPVARSVYFALVQIVAEAVGIYAEATRKDVALIAGVSVRTFDETVAVLEAESLVHRVKRREDGINLPNLWALGPGGGGAADAPTPARCTSAADAPQHPSSSSNGSNAVVKNDGGRPAALPIPLPDDVDVPDALLVDAQGLLRRKTKVGTQIATPAEVGIAVAVIAEFNRQSGSEFGVGAHLRAIVGRVRERPSYTVDMHVRLVQSAWRLRWWERSGSGRRPTPAVIYGNAGVFEAVVQDAVDEKKGRAVVSAAEPAKRFTRED